MSRDNETTLVKLPTKFLQDVMTAVTIAALLATPGALVWLLMLEWRVEQLEQDMAEEKDGTKVLSSIESRLAVLERATQDIEKAVDKLPQQPEPKK